MQNFKMAKGIATFSRRFIRAETGTVALIFGLSLTFIASIVGGAVDFGRWHAARNAMQDTMDAATLVAGRALQLDGASDDAAIAVARAFYERNKVENLVNDSAEFTVTNGSLVESTLSAQLDTTFLKLVGIQQLPLNITVRAELAGGSNVTSNLELSLMLDMTGSMCPDGSGPCTTGPKLDALKTAAKDLAKIAIWKDQSIYTAKMAIVPFSRRIRVGPNGGGTSLMKDLTNLNATWSGWMKYCTNSTSGTSNGSELDDNSVCTQDSIEYASNLKMMPCVTDRTGPQEYTDVPPGTGTWLNANDGGRRPLSMDSSDTPLSTGTGASSADPSGQWNYSGSGECYDVAESNEILPLTSDQSKITAKIDSLEAFSSTAGALGVAWTWYLMSPEWSLLWPTESKPAPYADLTTMVNGKPKLRKVAVLMSDGEFNTFRNWKEQDQQVVSDRAIAICNNMKSKGIEIYAVAYDLDSLPSDKRAVAEATLKSCGTDLDHFYNTLDAKELKQAFRDIGLKVSTLRLSM